jgi:asparagine synthase (glutamine-hydrolysing)
MALSCVNIAWPEYWVFDEGSYVCGEAFSRHGLQRTLGLHSELERIKGEDSLIRWVSGLNGFFAIIKRDDKHLFAAVDRIRSMPLFYGTRAGTVFIGDDAEWVKKQMGDTRRDSVVEEEFMVVGYVTGQETLYKNVKQLQAGEYLIAEAVGDSVKTRTGSYYEFRHAEEITADEATLLAQLDTVAIECFERLIEWADGRTIVVPLSGGYDSRLITVMLKRLGYDRVLAFTYGLQGNAESRMSMEVAKRLGFDWVFIPYGNEEWFNWFRTPERVDYFKMAHGLSSVPHLQDWPAVWKMSKEGLIDDSSVFVPGHAGDFVAGSHIPMAFADAEKISLDSVIESILSFHYSLWDWGQERSELYPIFYRRVEQGINAQELCSPAEAADCFEKWDWQERQAKFIVNSVKVYDYWGYKWWLPFWDNAIVEFWQRVPLRFRMRQRLYAEYVANVYSTVCGVSRHTAARREPVSPLNIVKTIVKHMPFRDHIRSLYRLHMMRHEYWNHPMAWYGILGKDVFDRYYTGRESINSFLAKYVVGQMTL